MLVEVVQYLSGRVADVDDAILNTLGTLLGSLLIVALDPSTYRGATIGLTDNMRSQQALPYRYTPLNAALDELNLTLLTFTP
ncbi:MAG: VanZ family protein [Nocardioidaceae bacterium]